jgi:hypothetical protein
MSAAAASRDWRAIVALACTWEGYADTDIDVGTFFFDDHTLTVRFLLQYPNAYQCPMVAVNGTGTLFVGQGDFDADPPGATSKLLVRLGNAQAIVPVSFAANSWHHLALVRAGADVSLFLDGQPVGAPLRLTGVAQPAGTLRFGKDTFDPGLDRGGRQFTGCSTTLRSSQRPCPPLRSPRSPPHRI